jgi:hypothetical protein
MLSGSFEYRQCNVTKRKRWKLNCRLRPPLRNSQVGSCNYFFGACSAFNHVMACTLGESPSDLYTESSDSFVASAAASIATGWSEPVPGRELHPLKSSAFHGARLRQLRRLRSWSPPITPVCRLIGNLQRTTRSVSPNVLSELRPVRRIKSHPSRSAPADSPHPQVCYRCWI